VQKNITVKNMKKSYENYPWWSIVVSNLVPLGIYIIAGYVIFQFGLTWFLVYLAYFAILEITFYPQACVYCYYYGKWCAFGKGKVAALLFKRKEPQKFCERQAKLINILPELLVVIVPVVLGVVLLLRNFNLIILIIIVLDVLLWTFGNALVRGKLACPNCQQGEICCPTKDMFLKKTKKN